MTDFSNFKEIAEYLPSNDYAASRLTISLTAWYSEKGLYYMACVPWDKIKPTQIATIRGEVPPSDQDEFNKWMLGLTRAVDGFKFNIDLFEDRQSEERE